MIMMKPAWEFAYGYTAWVLLYSYVLCHIHILYQNLVLPNVLLKSQQHTQLHIQPQEGFMNTMNKKGTYIDITAPVFNWDKNRTI